MASPVAHASAKFDLIVKGTVTVLTPSSGTPTSVTIQPANPTRPTENILLSASTVYEEAGATVTVAALVVGVPVQMTLTGSPATAAMVKILSPQPVFVGGTVTALTPSSGTPTSVTVQPRDQKKPTVNIALGAGTLYYAGGVSTTVASLSVGAQVELQATGTPATATVVEIEVPRPIVINGVVTALTPSSGTPTSVTVLPYNHHSVAVSIALGAGTVYKQAGATVTVADLMVGSNVQIEASGNPETATIVRIAVPKPVHLNGMVTELSPSRGTPTSVTVQPDGFFKTPVTVDLGPATAYWQLKATTTVAALLVGSRVELTAAGNPLTATVVHISAPQPDITVGSVTGVTSTTMTVQSQTTGSTPIIFTLTNATTYFAGRQISTIAEVNVGDIIRVAAAASAPTTAVSVTVRNIVVIGRVTGVVGDVISVTGFYGDALTVNVTGSTTFVLAGQASSLSAVLPGDLVTAIGPAMSGVTDSVTATNVWIGTRDNSIFHNAWIQHSLFGKRHHR
jgi:sRNA-binding protein